MLNMFYDTIYISKCNHRDDFTIFYKGIEADRNINDLFTDSIHVIYSI